MTTPRTPKAQMWTREQVQRILRDVRHRRSTDLMTDDYLAGVLDCANDAIERFNAAPAEAPKESCVAGVYMDRSIADFQRSCEVHIAEEQRKPNPDTALIALICDAVRCSRELTALATKDDSALVEAGQRPRAFAEAIVKVASAPSETPAQKPPPRDLAGRRTGLEG